MSSFTKLPPLKGIPPDYKLYTVEVAFEYHIGSEDSDEIVYVPKGFITDIASIPKIFWSLIGSPIGKYAAAAVTHDILYKYGIYSKGDNPKEKINRGKSDWVFVDAMRVLKVAWWKRRSMWFAVRVGGWRPWNKYRNQDKED